MKNILYEPFPETVSAGGQEYRIYTDFREWLRFADMLKDDALNSAEKAQACSMWLDPEPAYITAELMQALLSFYRADDLQYRPETDGEPPEETPRRPPLFDWPIDARYVLGDFLHFYRIDLHGIKYLHWWHFLSLFTALPDDSACMKRIAYRGADLSKIKNKDERQRIAGIQRQIALPFEFDDEMIGAALWEMK